MKYISEILIKIPLKEFLDKLSNYNNMKYWQRGLESYEHISGEPGKLGAKMKFNYKFGNYKMYLIETITHSNFPNEYHVYHDTEGIHNIHQNYFEETPNGYTKWTFKSECIPTTFSMRAKMLLMPWLYKKQILKYLEDFKNFAERGVSVLNYA